MRTRPVSSFQFPILLLSLPFLLVSPENLAQPANAAFLPNGGRIFPALYLDPNESQAIGAVNAYWEDGYFENKTYMPVGFGFYKGLYRWGKQQHLELGFDAAAQAQFEWDFDNETNPRNFLNADFRVSLLLHVKLQCSQALRFRFYHVSSHLGDDYLIQNGIHGYFPNPNNYEQIDLTWYAGRPLLDFYAGAGVVVRPETIRRRISLQAGSYFDKNIREGRLPLAFISGFDLKILQEDDFIPRLKAAAGLRFGPPDRTPVRLVIEFYRGHLPYGPYEYKKVQWLGLGLYFSP